MKISVLIPCYNEEKSIQRCVQSALDQTRPLDEIVVVNDGSTDKSPIILKKFGKKIKVINIYPATGNKSYAQEQGLKHVTGDVFISTDGDTILDKNFVKRVELNFQDDKLAAIAGYVNSLKHNWITTFRAYDYSIGQNIHKLAQDKIDYIFVIPGAAGAFRTDIFRQVVGFDHDTLTEDLDFTFKLHKKGYRIKYDSKAIIYTQDPPTLKSYINQMRRWYGGGWQNISKHLDGNLIDNPKRVLELCLIYVDGLVYTSLLFILPTINILLALKIFLLNLIIVCFQAIYASIREKRWDILMVPLFYPVMMYVNAYVSLEQFVKEIILHRKNMVWYHPERYKI